MKKISLKEHLQILIDPSNNLEEDAHTLITSYKKFCQDLKINERNAEGDKLFKVLYENSTNLKSIFAKKNGKEKSFERMIDIYEAQYAFFESRYKKMGEKYEELLSEKYKMSEGMIAKEELIHRNSIGLKHGDELQPDPFLLEIDNRWEKFRYNYFNVLEAILDPHFYNLHAGRWKEILDFEKEYYNEIKENKKPIYDVTANHNVHKNLYIYSRNCYMKNFYVAQLPDINLFSTIKKFEYSIEKEIYSLRDIASIYRNMLGLPDDEQENKRQYENIKKVFQNNKHVECFKKDGKYVFPQRSLNIVLTTYMFFRRKNNSQENYEEKELNQIINSEYARILDALVNRSDECRIIVDDFLRFYKNEYDDIFGSLNNDYQDAMIEYLLTSTERLYYRVVISDEERSKEAVYGI